MIGEGLVQKDGSTKRFAADPTFQSGICRDLVHERLMVR